MKIYRLECLEFEDRKVVFCHVYSSLLDFFKARFIVKHLINVSDTFAQALMVPYMAFTWQALLEQLRKHTPSAEEGQLWLTVLWTLAKSVSADEDRGMYLTHTMQSSAYE